jgi:hemerythrin-like domain-containing protein
MQAIEELEKEHEEITQMLLILETVAGKLERQETVPIEDLEKMVEFIEILADHCHHAKEEDYLFPALEQAGLPQQGHPVETLLEEHATGRRLTATLKECLSRMRSGDKAASLTFAETVSQYMDLLELHIEKERTVLFPLAEKHLGACQDADLMIAFGKIEQERIGSGRHEAFHKLLRRLKKTYPD